MISKMVKIAHELDKKGHNDLADRLDVVAFAMHRKKKSPIAHTNLINQYHALVKMLDSPIPENVEYAKVKLEELEPVFRMYAPELFQERLI